MVSGLYIKINSISFIKMMSSLISRPIAWMKSLKLDKVAGILGFRRILLYFQLTVMCSHRIHTCIYILLMCLYDIKYSYYIN